MALDEEVDEHLQGIAHEVFRWADEQHRLTGECPSKVQLMKEARRRYSLGLKDAHTCVDWMELHYEERMGDMGYYTPTMRREKDAELAAQREQEHARNVALGNREMMLTAAALTAEDPTAPPALREYAQRALSGEGRTSEG